MNVIHKLLSISSFFILGACSAGMESRLENARSNYLQNSPITVAKSFDGVTDDYGNLDNLELLIAGDALFRANEFEKSDDIFEEFNRRQLNLTDFDMGREATILLGGNMSASYRPFMMDSLFASYYQLWDVLALNEMDNAQVVINQAYEKQKKMGGEYEELINQTNENIKNNQDEFNALFSDRKSTWKVYSEIMNPALTYLSGLYFLNVGDFTDAKTFLERAGGMMPNNSYIDQDLSDAKSKRTPNGIAWIFIENSFAPKLTEQRTEIPWIIDGNLTFITMATSQPMYFNTDPVVKNSKLLADVDAMFMTEYQHYRENEELRMFASAVSKTILQSTMYNSGSDASPLMGLMATAYSMATTSAEVRTFATLPKSIWLYRVKKPNNGEIELKTGSGTLTTINIPVDGNHIIYVRPNKLAVDTKIIRIK